ncbi:MAG: NAD-dependent epimerase/dehydratase family protein [Sterolibacterium sp.]|jgi:GDP-L-fucose synthase
MYKDAHVLVAGGGGFVGANLVQRLLSLDARVTATLHESAPVIKDDRVRYVRCDLTMPGDCRSVVQGMDFVFMCAANTSGAALMEQDPLALFTPNLLMNSLMLQAAYEAHVKNVLFISSSTVYPVTDRAVKENEAGFEFFDKYFVEAWMKRFSEIMCEIYATRIRQPMRITLVRPANLYGEYDNFDSESSHVIPALIRKVVERHSPIEVWGDGSDVKEFLYIQDFIDGMLLAMRNLTWFEPINIAAGNPCSINDLLNTILDVDGYRDAKIVYNKSKPMMIPKRMMDTSKAKAQIQFEAKVSLKEGIRRTLAWYRHNNQV